MNSIRPGLLVLHGNRMEDLRDLTLHCFTQWPLAALEEEILLVSSHGAGEWLKMSWAQHSGIFAAARVQLPARFQWQMYRQILIQEALPTRAPLDRESLLWRLMHRLPELSGDPRFEVILGRLRGADAGQWYPWALHLADLYDQYQVYRMDWLELWSRGLTFITDASGRRTALPVEQRWQAFLWFDLVSSLAPAQRNQTRPAVHQRALARLRALPWPKDSMPRRITVFGASTLAPAMLELLVALASHVQVIVAVPNPCRFHWADCMEGRETWAGVRRRHPLRQGHDLADLPLQQAYAVAHPLLAAWGRQGRDFMRQLDRFDDVAQAREQFALPRTEVFSEDKGSTLLEQVQAAIRDLLPLQEHPATRFPQETIPQKDRSIQFHVAYSPLREMELLHDQLLDLLAQRQQPALQPRDILVMVPEIAPWIPRIKAVFGQYAVQDPRFIPFAIADQPLRPDAPLLLALKWLLNIDCKRITTSEVRALLEVPAIAACLGLDSEAQAHLLHWISESGVRWGLHQPHRAQLGLQACSEVFTWRYGLQRMLLGFASGNAQPYRGIEPYPDIGGLEAGLVGILALFLDRLEQWWIWALQPAIPALWAERARDLLERWVSPQDAEESALLADLQDALDDWLETCSGAAFEAPVPLMVFREAWLSCMHHRRQHTGRFLAGGVTFCSLMPLRAIPFQVVCLAGMNEADYPRKSQTNDFDLMSLAGQYRPGDRSRREDDRYLMLEALLSARRVLSISWTGRSLQDGSPCPPSVLVSQLRDYLAAGWCATSEGTAQQAREDLLRERTTEHPMQPFSRGYFENRSLHTYAIEWRAAHELPQDPPSSACDSSPRGQQVTLQQLAGFLRNPVKTFFKTRLGVQFEAEIDPDVNDELMTLDARQRYHLLQTLLEHTIREPHPSLEMKVARSMDRLTAGALLPLGGPGATARQTLQTCALDMLRWWTVYRDSSPAGQGKQLVFLEQEGFQLEDWLVGLGGSASGYHCVDWTPSRLAQLKNGEPEPLLQPLLRSWLTLNAAASTHLSLTQILVGPDVVLALSAPDPGMAQVYLRTLLSAWREGQEAPLPWALRTALHWCAETESSPTLELRAKSAARSCYEGGWADPGERNEPCLARLYPDFDALIQDGRFARYTHTLIKPFREWAKKAVRVLHSTSDPAGVRTDQS